MLSVYIIEDEIWIRAGIKKMIHWDELGLSLTGESGNGLAARRELLRLKPDIVISDIRVPDMNGLQLIEEVSRQIPIKTIFISGYKEFEYAHKAIELKAIRYLLKPIKEAELNQVLQETAGKIRQERAQSREAHQSRDSVLLNALEERIDQSDSVQQEQEVKKYGVLLIPAADQKLYDKIKQYLGKHPIPGIEGSVFRKNQYEYVVIFTISLKVRPAEKLLQYCQDMFDYFMVADQAITWALGSIVLQLSDIPVSYNHAWMTYSCRGVRDAGVLMQYEKLDRQGFLLPAREQLEQLYYALETGNLDKLRETAQEIFTAISNNGSASVQNVMDCMFYLLLELIRLLQKEGISTSAYYEKCRDLLSARFRYKNLAEISAWFLAFIEAMIKEMEEKNDKNITLAVGKVKAYIDQHYTENITLQGMADMVFINRSYLSTSFRKIVGEKFIIYIMKKRLEKAAELLRDTNLCVAEIAQIVGYDNVRHFSRTFRKYMGLLPTDYRGTSGKERHGEN